MSSQRGNTKRTRPQKYQNASSFRNDLHDHSKKTKDINNLEVAEVCKQCKDVIQWKIKYKKYKPLTQPKTCLNCHQKSIKSAYHTLCDSCGKNLGVCCKCRQAKEVFHKSVKMKPKKDVLAMMSKDLKCLPERKRRTFYRYVDSIYEPNKTKKKKKARTDGEEDKLDETSSVIEDVNDDYLERIRKKLEELGKDLLSNENSDSDDFNGSESEPESCTS